MKGGYQILDLSSITLVKDTETTITDLNILDQLLGLTDFLNKNGLIDKQLKPIYVITKDSAGYVSITNNDTRKLLIDGYISGLHIQLNITYTSSLDDYGNTVYAVSSAKYTYVLIDDNIKNIIESGNVENAKPIYWHSIELKRIDNNVLIYLAEFIILNNDPTPFTLATFKTWLNAHPEAIIQVTQGYDSSQSDNIVNTIQQNPEYENQMIVSSISPSTGEVTTQSWTYNASGSTLSDNGVNKIN